MTDETKKKFVAFRIDDESARLHEEAASQMGLSLADWRRASLEEKAAECLGLRESKGNKNSFPSNQSERMMLKVVMMLGAHFLYNLPKEEQERVQAKAKELLAEARKSDAS